MGFYIETREAKNKALQLKRDYDAQVISEPEHVDEAPHGKTIVCVVENGTFDAAAIVYSDDELQAFREPDGRRRTWLLMDTSKVIQLNPAVERWLLY